MCRLRYGTEIRTDFTTDYNNFVPGYAAAITNLGPGHPMIQDFLITGDGAAHVTSSPPGVYSQIPGGATYHLGAGILAFGSSTIFCSNIAIWGISGGAFLVEGGGTITMPHGASTCFAFGNSWAGIYATFGSRFICWSGIGLFSNVNGVYAGDSQILLTPGEATKATWINYNTQYGIWCSNSAYVHLVDTNSNVLGNTTVDLYAASGGYNVFGQKTSVGTMSPAFQTYGNFNGINM
jgi:hypothetical protein